MKEKPNNLSFSLLDKPDTAVAEEIFRGLIAYNEKSFGVPFHSRLLCATVGEELIGGAAFWWYEPDAGIEHLYVKEGWRGRGIGRRLLEEAEAELRKNGCRQVTVGTYANMAPDYYPKAGYEKIGIIPRFLLGYDYLCFRKNLLKE